MDLTTIADGFAFIEGPRWHDGALWFSDMHGGAIYRLVETGEPEKIVEIVGRPSGLGWLPNGNLLIASMMDRTVYEFSGGHTLKAYADLSGIAERRINDMVVDQQGRAWVGNFGFLFDEGEAPATGTLARVDPDGTIHAAADGLMFANGMLILPGTNTLVVAETFGAKLTAFDISADGTLSGRRTWASVSDGAVPDGICVDADSAIWVASPTTGTVLRILHGGTVTDTIITGRSAIACALGGEDGRTLLISTAASTDRDKCIADRSARIESVRVDVPAA